MSEALKAGDMGEEIATSVLWLKLALALLTPPRAGVLSSPLLFSSLLFSSLLFSSLLSTPLHSALLRSAPQLTVEHGDEVPNEEEEEDGVANA